MKKLAIFDMDGTILYTLDDITDGLNHALKKNGLPEIKKEAVRHFIGNGIMHEVENAVPPGTNKDMIMKVFEDFNSWYAIHCGDHTHPYEGIEEVIQNLRDAGMKTAVVSNKGDYAVQELDEQYFKGLFDIGVGEKEGIRRKPAPDTVNTVLEQLGVGQEDAVYIGDSEVDIETAENAGMDCIIVEWGYRDKKDMEKRGAKVFAKDMSSLEKLLLQS